MSIMNIFDTDDKKFNKNYLTHLIHVAKSDGFISDQEKKLLHRLGHRLGLVDEEITKLIDNPGQDSYIPPYELIKKFEHVFDIVKITLADGIITKDEHRIAKCYALASGFSHTESEKVIDIVIKAINNGSDEDDALKEYRKLR